MIIPMLCVTIFVILVVWFLLPRVARLMIHTPTAISIFVCLSMRSEERFSRNAETDLVCRLLLEKKKSHSEPRPTGNVPLQARGEHRYDATISVALAARHYNPSSGADLVTWWPSI